MHDVIPAETPQASYVVSLPLLLLVTTCFFMAFFILNPGLMSYDSMVTWRMSGGAPMTDAHPPAYTLLLRGLRFLWDSPAVMVFFNVGAFLSGALLLGETIRQRRPLIAYMVPLFIFLPFILNFIGVLWKDTALAVCWWAAASIAIYARSRPDASGWRLHALMCAAYAFFLFGLLARHNGVTAAPFLLSALVFLHIGRSPSFRQAIIALAIASAAALGVLKVGSATIAYFYPVQKIDMLNDLILYDLAGITKQTGQNAFAVEFSDEELARAMDCYQLTDWNSYADSNKCLFVMDRHGDQDWFSDGKPVRFWIKSIAEHPLAYTRHRLAVFSSFLRIGSIGSYSARHHGIDANDLGLSHPEPPLFQAFQAYIASTENAFFMQPWFWLLANISAAMILARRRSDLIQNTALLVSLAGTVYLLTYLPFGIASDFRYAYWSIMAALFSWSVVAGTPNMQRRKRH